MITNMQVKFFSDGVHVGGFNLDGGFHQGDLEDLMDFCEELRMKHNETGQGFKFVVAFTNDDVEGRVL